MSRSNPSLTNPAHRFFEWKAEAGELQYYDKEKQERVKVNVPFEFLVLDELATITGYSKPDKASYYSNEVRNSAKEPFTIKLKGGVVTTTLYKNEQGVVIVPKAAKYTKSIYIAYKENGEFVIGNLKAPVGSVLSAWIDFTKHHKVQDTGKVIMTRGEKVEGDRSDYFPPAFEFVPSSTEEDQAAVVLDKALQIYLGQYLAANSQPDEDSVHTEDYDDSETKATPAQIAEFESLKAKKLKPQDEDDDTAVDTYTQVAANEYEDEPFTDDMIPPEFR